MSNQGFQTVAGPMTMSQDLIIKNSKGEITFRVCHETGNVQMAGSQIDRIELSTEVQPFQKMIQMTYPGTTYYDGKLTTIDAGNTVIAGNLKISHPDSSLEGFGSKEVEQLGDTKDIDEYVSLDAATGEMKHLWYENKQGQVLAADKDGNFVAADTKYYNGEEFVSVATEQRLSPEGDPGIMGTAETSTVQVAENVTYLNADNIEVKAQEFAEEAEENKRVPGFYIMDDNDQPLHQEPITFDDKKE